MLKKKLLAGGLIALAVLVGIVSGCRHHSTPEEKLDRIIAYLTDDMDLNSEQIQMLDKLKADVVGKFEGVRNAKEDAHGVIVAQIKSDEMDTETVMTAIEGVRREVGEVLAVAVVDFAEFQRTLTPEQKEQLIEQLEDLRKLHGCGR